MIQPKSRERRSLCANLYKLLAVIRVGWIITVLFLLKTNMFWNTINILLFSKKAFVKEIIEYFTHIFRLKICRGFIALKTNIIAKKIEYRKFYSVYSIRGNSTHLKKRIELCWGVMTKTLVFPVLLGGNVLKSMRDRRQRRMRCYSEQNLSYRNFYLLTF